MFKIRFVELPDYKLITFTTENENCIIICYKGITRE